MITSLTYGTSRISLAINQSIYAGIGILVMLLVSRFDYRNWRGFAGYFYVLVLILLLAVERFGVEILGARRWLDIGGFFNLQPSELAKLALAIILAKFFADRDELQTRDYLQLGGLVVLPIGLILIQPDLGTAVILSLVAFGLFVVGGVSRKALLGLIGIGLASLPIAWQFLADYQKQRVLTFLNPEADPYGAGYNVLQALIAVGSGGLFGQGLGQGSQSQQEFLPVAHTDFIFASVAEATGLVGSLVLIGLLTFLILRVIRVAQVARDDFGYYLAVGIAVLFLAHTTINIAMNLALAPVTGIPLPFVSHGGTALITNFIAIGILQSIMLRHKKITF
jgi:rod shape determining protein RodA